MSKENELITAQDLSSSLNLSVETIWRYTRENRIPYLELGRKQYRYKLDEVISALNCSAVREKEPPYKADTSEKFTYQDYLKLPEEPGYRFEVLDGILIKEPSPNVNHQRVSRRLQRILEDYFWMADPGSEIFDAPLDVTFHDINVVQPDLLYITGQQKALIRETHIDGPPALVVEIISPSSKRKDRFKKMQIYQKAGVQHYWLADPEEQSLECYSLRDKIYALITAGLDEDILEHPDFPGLSINLSNLWAPSP